MKRKSIMPGISGVMKYEDFSATHYIVRDGNVKKGDMGMISSYSKGLYGAFKDITEEYHGANVSMFHTIIRKKKSKLARLGTKYDQ